MKPCLHIVWEIFAWFLAKSILWIKYLNNLISKADACVDDCFITIWLNETCYNQTFRQHIQIDVHCVKCVVLKCMLYHLYWFNKLF